MTRHRWTLIALLLILLLAAGLRLYRLDAQSLWYDEGASVGYALRTPGDIWRNTAADIHPPGYYLLLSRWVGPLGTSELALRGLSVVFGLLLVAQVYSLGRALFHPTVGLLAGALIAIDPFHVYYSQEARMYTLLASLGAASMWLFIQWLETLQQPAAHRRRPWLLLAGLVLVNAAGLYTHYIYPLFIGVEMLLFLAMGIYLLFTLGMQSIENSLISRLTPDRWRSTAFGLKFILTFGIGALGVVLTGRMLKATGSVADVFVLVGLFTAVVAGLSLVLYGISCRAIPRLGQNRS